MFLASLLSCQCYFFLFVLVLFINLCFGGPIDVYAPLTIRKSLFTQSSERELGFVPPGGLGALHNAAEGSRALQGSAVRVLLAACVHG